MTSIRVLVSRQPLMTGLVFAGVHFVVFLISIVIANQAEGWAGVFVWPVWLVVDLPWSLACYLVVFGTPLASVLSAIRPDQSVLDYLLYPPYFIHGVIGTVWWGFVPRVYVTLRRRRASSRAD